MTNRERIRNQLQAIKFEDRIPNVIGNLNEIDPTGEIELELRLEDIGIDQPEHIETFKALSLDDQIRASEALIKREKDGKNQYPTSIDNADLIRRLKALLSFIVPTPPAENAKGNEMNIRSTGIFRSSLNSGSYVILETSTNQFCTFNAVGVDLQTKRIFGEDHQKRGILEDLDIEISDETGIDEIDEILIEMAKDEFAEVVPLEEISA